MKLPSKARVCGTWVPIEYMPKNLPSNALYGQYNPANPSISINNSLGKSAEVSVVLHEILHAIIDLQGIASALELDAQKEETLVRILEPALMMLIRDNPKLVEYLTDV